MKTIKWIIEFIIEVNTDLEMKQDYRYEIQEAIRG
jgi:hypothetical protein